MSRLIINKKYPDGWEQYSEREKCKKCEEFKIVSFFLNDTSVVDLFAGEDNLNVEFREGPDFFIYSDAKIFSNLGLEITKCYVDDSNSHRIKSDLKKICEDSVKDIQKQTNSCHGINYVLVTFTHEIMVGKPYVRNELKSELKDFILNGNNKQGKYIVNIDMGYSIIYPKDYLNISIISEMAYIVPTIEEVVNMQEQANIVNYDPIQRSIREKEQKLVLYKQRTVDLVGEWWLCIEIPDDAFMNSISYQLPTDFTSEYDKIFLVNRSVYGHGVRLIFNA